MKALRSVGVAVVAVQALLVHQTAASAVAGQTGAVEITVTLPAGAGPAPVSISLGDRVEPLEKGAAGRRIDGLGPGRYVLLAEALTAEGRLLAAAPVTVGAGETARADLALGRVDAVDEFCAPCHPSPGEGSGAGQVPRDLHVSGVQSGAGAVTCESCHSLHRPTPSGSFTLAPFREGGDLCLRCHAGGHAGRTAGLEGCLNCHTLNVAEAEPGTSLISAASRTLPIIKSLSGGTVPEDFGCTYCHGGGLARARMRNALADFGAQASKHPVGVDMRTGAETMNEYLSGTARNFPGELGCVDCHDPALLVDQAAANLAGPAPYANHADPAGAGRSDNPLMLRVADRDGLCRSCHGPGAGNAKAVATPPPHGVGAPVEPDGTPLRIALCTGCHNSHSSTNFKLFADGRQGVADVGFLDTRTCTARCHFRGDSDGSYDTRGHGMATGARRGTPMKFGCGTCHASNAKHESERPMMLNFDADPGRSAFGSSVTSVCHVCHGDRKPHAGAGGRAAGCIDCHDEHAEGVQAAGNRAMIPGALPKGGAGGEPTVFAGRGAGALDYYRPSGDGLCDNAICHGGLKAPDGTPFAPLLALMRGGHHSGGDQDPGSDCGDCHRHGDSEGSWTGR